MIFNDETTRQLKGKLNGAHVRTRQWQGKTLSYIEGWHAIDECNRIFGFDGWSRLTTLTLVDSWERKIGKHEADGWGVPISAHA